VLFGQAKHLLIVHFHVPILIGSSTVEHHDQRQRGLAIPLQRDVQPIRDVRLRRRKSIRAMLISFGARLRVSSGQQRFCKLLRFQNLLIGVQGGTKRTRRNLLGLLRYQRARDENDQKCQWLHDSASHFAAARFSEKKGSTFAAKRAVMRFP